MKIEQTGIADLLLIQPQVFGDARGYFLESWNKQKFADAGLKIDFDQDNQSLSQKGVLRGLHFQKPPYQQGKLVRVIKGAVLDVAVDLRKSSKTYGKHFAAELNEENKTMMWIPPGFAHGFLTLEDNTVFAYKCQGLYAPDYELCIAWNDETLGIDWGVENPLLSAKDQKGLAFADYQTDFK